jgi:hypothetical protein
MENQKLVMQRDALDILSNKKYGLKGSWKNGIR